MSDVLDIITGALGLLLVLAMPILAIMWMAILPTIGLLKLLGAI